jgi:hypothetical protein
MIMKYLLLLLIFSIPAIAGFALSAGGGQPDPTFRLSTIERRIDQMQSRLDLLEREVRSSSAPGPRSESFSELRLQYQGLSEQVSFMQMQLIEARKAIDKLNDAEFRRNEAKEQQKPKDEKKKP